MNRWWAKLLLGGGASAPLYILLLGISNGRKRRTWGSGGAARSSPYSRPLDVHRWSDHPEVTGLVDNLWQAHFSDMGRPARNPGPKPKTSFQQQLRVLILDPYVAWLEDPALCIGVAMSVNHWDTTSRYNALNISKQIIPLVKRLQVAGLIDLARGSYGGPYATTNRTTRIRASRLWTH